MKLHLKEVLKPTAVLFAICVVVSAALAGTNLLTKDRITAAAAAKAEESRKLVLPQAEKFEEYDLQEEGVTCHVGRAADGSVAGYVFETSAKGYGGDVKVMTGILQDGNAQAGGQITGVVILSHGETPGLGANAEKEAFRDQYKQSVPEAPLQIVKYQTPAAGQIEAMTGATITSTAVTNAVNQAREVFNRLFHAEPAGGE